MKNSKTLFSKGCNTERKAKKSLEKMIKMRGEKCIVEDEIRVMKATDGKYLAYVEITIV